MSSSTTSGSVPRITSTARLPEPSASATTVCPNTLEQIWASRSRTIRWSSTMPILIGVERKAGNIPSQGGTSQLRRPRILSRTTGFPDGSGSAITANRRFAISPDQGRVRRRWTPPAECFTWRTAGTTPQPIQTGRVRRAWFVEVVLVQDEPGFAAALAAGAFDVILCDYNLPSYSNGIAALKLARERQPKARCSSSPGRWARTRPCAPCNWARPTTCSSSAWSGWRRP